MKLLWVCLRDKWKGTLSHWDLSYFFLWDFSSSKVEFKSARNRCKRLLLLLLLLLAYRLHRRSLIFTRLCNLHIVVVSTPGNIQHRRFLLLFQKLKAPSIMLRRFVNVWKLRRSSWLLRRVIVIWPFFERLSPMSYVRLVNKALPLNIGRSDSLIRIMIRKELSVFVWCLDWNHVFNFSLHSTMISTFGWPNVLIFTFFFGQFVSLTYLCKGLLTKIWCSIGFDILFISSKLRQ